MAFSFLKRRREASNIERLYGAIVTQARMQAFYATYGVPDTPEGRFEMIVLHLALVLRRLRRVSAESDASAQALFDAFCADMDGNLREMGLSDVKVPRTMRRLGEAFYGRAAAYDGALDAAEPAQLLETLARNVYGDPAHIPDGAPGLSAYVRMLSHSLTEQSPDRLAAGIVTFAKLDERRSEYER